MSRGKNKIINIYRNVVAVLIIGQLLSQYKYLKIATRVGAEKRKIWYTILDTKK